MKCLKKRVLLSLVASVAACNANTPTAVTPYPNFRSQSQDLARQLTGVVDASNKADEENYYGNFAVTAEYTRSFNSDDIAHALFGCYYLQDCNTLKIAGAQADSYNEKSLNAQWFYLASDYEGSICFEPTIQNLNADMSLYWGMDGWVPGMFFRIHAPLTWTQWNLGAKFTTQEPGTLTPPDYTGSKLDDAETFFCAKGGLSLTSDDDSITIGTPLSCARFCGCECSNGKTKTRLADIQADWGWNFLLDEDYHLGCFARIVVPTGNAPKGEWLFEPIIGNGRHWECGAGLTSKAVLWESEEENKKLSISFDIEATHLFTAEQNRVFDLKNKPLSRYMYAYKTVDTVTTYEPLANLTSCKKNVSIKVQADIVALFNYTSDNWSYDLGYNFWARSCEHFDCDTCSCAACEECSCCGQGVIKNDLATWYIANASTINLWHDISDDNDEELTDNWIDYDGARTKGMSQKLFAQVNYTWDEHRLTPFLGLGGFVELGMNEPCCSSICNDCESCSQGSASNNSACGECSCCENVSLSQWGVWLKSGISF
jgi:hypothetical protein